MRRLILLALVPLAFAPAQRQGDGAPWWKSLHDRLTKPDAEEFFKTVVKDAELPGPELPAGLRGTIVSSSPEYHPTRLTLAMYGATTPEVTIRLERSLPMALPEGTVVRFQGVAVEFTRDPFMLIFEVDPDDRVTFVRAE
jgi:hypothetical protein